MAHFFKKKHLIFVWWLWEETRVLTVVSSNPSTFFYIDLL